MALPEQLDVSWGVHLVALAHDLGVEAHELNKIKRATGDGGPAALVVRHLDSTTSGGALGLEVLAVILGFADIFDGILGPGGQMGLSEAQLRNGFHGRQDRSARLDDFVRNIRARTLFETVQGDISDTL